MCTKNKLDEITGKVAAEAKRILDERLISVVLFGSYARGDYDDESDIDIMLLVNCDKSEYAEIKKKLYKEASMISLENDIEVSLTLVEISKFEMYKDCYPFYENIESEGIKIA